MARAMQDAALAAALVAVLLPLCVLGADEPPRPAAPLPVADLDRLQRRAEENLNLHGLSLLPEYVLRALRDAQEAVEGLPADVDSDRKFRAHFTLAFAILRTDPPADLARAVPLRDMALRSLAAAASTGREFPGLWIVDGMAREFAGENAEAVERITRGLDALGEGKDVPQWLLRDLRFFGLLSRGRAELEGSINKEDMAERDFLEALSMASAALRDPAAPRVNRLRRVVLTHLAAAQQGMEYFEKAEKTLRLLITDEDPANYVHPFNLGLVLAYQHRYPEAVACYRKSVELNPRFAAPHMKIAFVLLTYPEGRKEPDLEGAAREGEIYRALAGEDAEYHALRGEIDLARGDEASAERWFRGALARNPVCQRALSRLVQILGGRQEPTDAQRAEMDALRRRLEEEAQKHRIGMGKESRRAGRTFC